MTAPAAPSFKSASSESAEKPAAASSLTVTFTGRIKGSEKVETEKSSFHRTLVVIPARDSYSHPQTIPVCASTKLGSDGADVTVTCEIQSYPRKKDGETYYNIQLWRAD